MERDALQHKLTALEAENERLREELLAERARATAFQRAHEAALEALSSATSVTRLSRDRRGEAARQARHRALRRLGYAYSQEEGWKSPTGERFDSPVEALGYAQAKQVSRDVTGQSRIVTGQAALMLVPPPLVGSPLSPIPPIPSPLSSPLPSPSLREGPALAVPPAGQKKRTAKPPGTTEEERSARKDVEEAYIEARGEPYPWGAEDWTALRRCLALAEHDPAMLLARWNKALEMGTRYPGCSKLRQLASNWGALLAEMQAPPPRPRSPREQRAALGGDIPNVPGMAELYEDEGS